ncbi:MAG TPA: hypothetical protein VFH97_07770 [Gemmatimonadales bacterium]|nr:hypothetical protein [Gemmatimonadales bacterium]
MSATAPSTDYLRTEAARLAATLLRFEEPAAHLSGAHTPEGRPRVGTDGYVFLPSWRTVPRAEVEAFLVALPSPALLVPTTIRGVIAVLLLHELSGDRRRWGEKTLSNFAANLEEVGGRLGLSDRSRILVEFDEESHVFPFAAVREWTQQFPVQLGWNLSRLEEVDRADAVLRLMRSDFRRFPGRSCMMPTGWTPANE